MKKIIFMIFMLVFLIQLASSLEITREFSSDSIDADKNVIVKLIVKVSPDDEVYVIEESVPNLLTIVDSNDGSYAKGKMLWVIKDDIEDTELSYKIKGTYGGDYEFKGIFSVNGMAEENIGGDGVLTIVGVSGPSCGNGKCDSGEDYSNCPFDCKESSSSNGGGSSSVKSSVLEKEIPYSEEISEESTQSFGDMYLKIKRSFVKGGFNYMLLIIILVLLVLVILLIYILKKIYKGNTGKKR